MVVKVDEQVMAQNLTNRRLLILTQIHNDKCKYVSVARGRFVSEENVEIIKIMVWKPIS